MSIVLLQANALRAMPNKKNSSPKQPSDKRDLGKCGDNLSGDWVLWLLRNFRNWDKRLSHIQSSTLLFCSFDLRKDGIMYKNILTYLIPEMVF